MKYQVPAAPADPKAQLTDITDKPELIADCEAADYARIVRDPGGKVYVYTSDLRKLRGEDVEIPIT